MQRLIRGAATQHDLLAAAATAEERAKKAEDADTNRHEEEGEEAEDLTGRVLLAVRAGLAGEREGEDHREDEARERAEHEEHLDARDPAEDGLLLGDLVGGWIVETKVDALGALLKLLRSARAGEGVHLVLSHAVHSLELLRAASNFAGVGCRLLPLRARRLGVHTDERQEACDLVPACPRGMNPPCLDELVPRLDAARDRDPARSVHLHNVRRRAAGVARTLNALHGTKGRDAHLDARAGSTIAERLQQISNCSSTRGSRQRRGIRLLAHNGGELARRLESYRLINSRSSHIPNCDMSAPQAAVAGILQGVKILVLGSGAREHALVAALAQEGTHELICAPGNPGIEQLATTIRVDANKPQLVADFAEEERVELVVIGPEAPLVAGVADELRRRGIPVFGPNQEPAKLEGSKTFAKQVMQRAGVPTGGAQLCTTMEEVERTLDQFGAPYVVKADGLASGKGVLVTEDRQAALIHADTWIPAGPILIEEFLDGLEVSQFVISDGETTRALPPAQDFKRIGDGDTGPNTGGMGAYSPVPFLNERFGSQEAFSEEVVRTVAQPIIDELRANGQPFQGLLYCGLIVTADGMRVIEFNARFGDPETQVVLPRLDMPLSELLYASATGTLADTPNPLPIKQNAAVTLVLASEGYPDAVQSGRPLQGLEDAGAIEGVHVMHAATGDAGEGEGLRATGGRVLNVVAEGATLTAARTRAYEGMAKISLEGGQFRRDIAERAAADAERQAKA